MSSALRLTTLLVCVALVCAAVVGGPGTGALLSDDHVAAGNISADVDNESTIDIIDETDETETNETETGTNETETNETNAAIARMYSR